MDPALVGRNGTLAAAQSDAVERARTGDRAAFEMLVRSRVDRLHRTACAILGNEADAYDATQDAFLSAWQQLPRLRDVEAFDAWLTRIIVNACRMRLRARRAVREVQAVEAEAAVSRPGRPRTGPAGGRRTTSRTGSPAASGSSGRSSGSRSTSGRSSCSTTSTTIRSPTSPGCSAGPKARSNDGCRRRGAPCSTSWRSRTVAEPRATLSTDELERFLADRAPVTAPPALADAIVLGAASLPQVRRGWTRPGFGGPAWARPAFVPVAALLAIGLLLALLAGVDWPPAARRAGRDVGAHVDRRTGSTATVIGGGAGTLFAVTSPK